MYKTLTLKEFVSQVTFNIVYYEQQKATAVLIPVSHWHPAKAAELQILMEQLTYIPVFECSLKELEERLRPEIQNVEAESTHLGLYNLYEPDGNQEYNNHVIREYADHRELVKVNTTTGDSQIVSRRF
ncbi:hypothetical protein [Mucilaginibacter sp. OK283]|jgi:hypothetical protein|uniref:hypothetical protein n=1 Tax=Mucilaginibacter sp. OK283 TaxID=1881049 RepID=UPI0008B089A1|nr:hypothetical protein [Mucilaginibacter sp. OK283]SEO93323.1 hypothetical protein SAMN05428947_105122 [Mucilaginibacter sp. OK283]